MKCGKDYTPNIWGELGGIVGTPRLCEDCSSQWLEYFSTAKATGLAVSTILGNFIRGATLEELLKMQERGGDENKIIRNWWHNLLRYNKIYSCYAILLVLPSDFEAIRYLKDFGNELNLISGEDCLVIIFGNYGLMPGSFRDEGWLSAVDEHSTRSYCIKTAEYFNIKYSEFPCLILFKDIKSQEHLEIALKSQTAEQIAENLRSIFYVIRQAITRNKNPINALDTHQKSEKLLKTGSSIVGGIQSLAGKSIESVFEAIINSSIK